MMDPVHFTTQLKELKNGEAELIFKATIDAGWHVYSTGLGNDGPISASFNKVKMDGAETVGKLQARGNEIKQFDKLFDMEVRYFEKAVTFVQKIKFTKPKYDIDCYVEYGACNDQSCLPPSEAAFKQSGNSPIEETADVKTEPTVQAVDTAIVETPVDTAVVDTMVVADNLWTPVVAELQSMNGESAPTENMALWLIFIEGLLGGFIALFTPCRKRK
jgi:thiol:disulfide interchange protein DsbD